VTPVRLGGYPAKQCARRIHNQHAPGTPEPLGISAEVLALWNAGRVFETDVVDELQLRYGSSPRLLVLDDSAGWAENQRRTAEAMNSGVAVIVRGRLPDVNARVGAPDVLVHHDDGYLPVDIKNHQTLSPAANPDSPKARSKVEVSTLTEPDQRLLRRGYSNRGNSWRDDVMQLSHYTRMLQEFGLHPELGPSVGGIIGTSDFTPLVADSLGITWYDLDEETIETYSATGPGHRRKRSALQRYDHEFSFRMTVAERARTGAEIVRPYRIAECDTCEWVTYCTEAAGPDDASFAIEAGHLNIREWQYLYQHCGANGTLSAAQLAAVDPVAHADGFREQSVGTQKPGDRLTAVVKRAQMTATGVDLEPRGPNPPQVPAADVEIDFDIEWDSDGRIYQWGLRIRDGQNDATSRYEPVVSFDPLDEPAEVDLAEKFADRINRLRCQADQEGKSLQIFHWHHPETSHTRKFAPVAAVLDGVTFDLMQWFNREYFARPSSSVKDVAAIFGFRWSVDDPGGMASKSKVDIARGRGPEAEAARRWCLTYNECDVAAQAAIRDGLRHLGR
jgi:predicted RecB family nuclease